MSLEIEFHPSVASIGKEGWDSCAARAGNPFLSYDFLDACESSGSARPETGWAPCHLVVRKDNENILGVMPLYIKGHSQGEYVSDHSWADAYERAGGRYYPKLLGGVPFTPATGPRLMVRPEASVVANSEIEDVLLAGAVQFCRDNSLSSLHINFLPKDQYERAGRAGFLQRQDQQFWFENPGYRDFEDFLSSLSSSRRKTIRRERREALSQVEVRVLTGDQIEEAHWEAFFSFYLDTGSRKWGRPHLTRVFFSRIGESMKDRIALIMAFRGERPIAGALNFIGADTLFGRQWGALEDVPFLHFELSYYQAIDLAIRMGLRRVEAGAQGEHKISRGYVPSAVYSVHYITDPGLRRAVSSYLDQERLMVQRDMQALDEAYSPYRKS